jgi:hypothetical protein
MFDSSLSCSGRTAVSFEYSIIIKAKGKRQKEKMEKPSGHIFAFTLSADCFSPSSDYCRLNAASKEFPLLHICIINSGAASLLPFTLYPLPYSARLLRG